MWSKRLATALAGAVLAVVASGATAKAEDFRLLMLGDRFVKWGQPSFGMGATVTYALADRRQEYPDAINCRVIDPIDSLLRDSRVSREAFMENLREGISMWESAANIKFRYTEDVAHADIVIGAQGLPRGIAFANVWHDGTQHEHQVAMITKATVCLNPQTMWKAKSDTRPDTYYLRHVLAHEIGHTIGLDHPGRTGQLMGYRYSEDTTALGRGDVDGSVTLYGPAPRSTVLR